MGWLLLMSRIYTRADLMFCARSLTRVRVVYSIRGYVAVYYCRGTEPRHGKEGKREPIECDLIFAISNYSCSIELR